MVKEMQNLKSKMVKMILDKVETVRSLRDKESRLRFTNNYDHFQDVIHAAHDDLKCISKLHRRLFKSQGLSLKEFTLMGVFLYLLNAEGIICNVLNFISYVLVSTGHDLYSLTKRKYVKDDIEEIRKVEMSTKIQFLKHHGFGPLTKEYDSTFRNDIAHHNYKVDEKGVLWVRGKRVDLSSKLRPLMKILDFIDEVVEETTEKVTQIYGVRFESSSEVH